jgi:hypothetical protein
MLATASAFVVATILFAVVGDAQFVPTLPALVWLLLLALTSQAVGWIMIARLCRASQP